ncbi:MAG: SusD/RagB family nutrient-binding outer membrane lipoprotein [Bacteroidota bacterium]
MKKIFIYITTILIVFTSCEKLEYTTEDPNNFSDATAELMINAPLLANAIIVEGELARTAGIWSGQFTGADRQYISLNRYIVAGADFNTIWGVLYAEGVAQSRLLQGKAQKDNNETLEGIAMIVEANLMVQATALWGDVPYSEVADVENYPEPKYDAQKEVYNALLDLLDRSIVKVSDATGESYGWETVGEETRNTMQWAKVAHSLKARIYLHLGEYANAISSANYGISSSSNDWLFYHQNISNGARNLYYRFCKVKKPGYMDASDAYMRTLMQDRLDARISYYYSGSDLDYTSSGIFYRDEDFPVITYYETELIKAEAELLANNNAANALQALNNVRSYWDNRIGVGSFPAYDAADFADNAALLKEILTEKYISCYGQIEVFNDMRRTDNYIGIPLKVDAPVQKMPERFIYPQTEMNSNSNVPDIQDIFTPTSVNTGTYPGSSL